MMFNKPKFWDDKIGIYSVICSIYINNPSINFLKKIQ